MPPVIYSLDVDSLAIHEEHLRGLITEHVQLTGSQRGEEILALAEVAIFIQDIGKAAGHPCAKVDAGFTEHADDAAGIIGNTCLYGATGGRLYAAGRAGERFAVRNSGAIEHADDAAGHIFTAVVADAFHHGNGAGVTHRETLTSTLAQG
jgi:hypothetical protein